MNSSGPNLAQVGPTTGGNARTRARIVDFAETPLPIQDSEQQPLALFMCLTNVCRNTPILLCLHRPKSTTASDAVQGSSELVLVDLRNDQGSTLAEIKFKS
jgi:hypothetical protein